MRMKEKEGGKTYVSGDLSIEQLPEKFVGVGAVSGFVFRLCTRGNQTLLYEVDTKGSKHYEVFKIRLVGKCLDFDNRIYSKSELKEKYPSANDFGKWAWSKYGRADAFIKFNKLENE